jgi:hypothetical protein
MRTPGQSTDWSAAPQTTPTASPNASGISASAGDRVRFAALAEAALAAGGLYVVVTGWRSHVLSTVDTLSAQRRPLADGLGLRPLLAAVAGGPVPSVS